MGTLNPAFPTVKEPKPSRGGGGGPIIRHPGGGGNGDHDRGGNGPDYGEQLRRYRLGLAVGMAAVVMLFISFTSAYIVRQGVGTFDSKSGAYVTDWQPLQLPTTLLILNTCLLVASSFTIEKARRRAIQQALIAPVTQIPGIREDEDTRLLWLWVTVLLGMGFLAGQLTAWRALEHRGFFLSTTPSSSFFYVLTGMHALHLMGGIVALLYASAVSLRTRAAERRRIVVDITAWYWHFMALLWIYVFALLKFAA